MLLFFNLSVVVFFKGQGISKIEVHRWKKLCCPKREVPHARGSSSVKHTNAIARATFGTMLFELLAGACDAGPQFKQHCPKRRAGRRVTLI